MVSASRHYYNAVEVLIQDLKKTLRKERDNDAVWNERYARKIDRLPVLNVDEELLAFGADTAERFRNIALSKRSAGVRAGVRKSNTYGNYYYGDGYLYRVDPKTQLISQVISAILR